MFLSSRSALAQQQYNIQVRYGDAESTDCAGTNNCYAPNPAIVSNGDTVVWTNNDYQLHTVTKDPSNDQTRSIFFSELLKPGGKYSFIFSTAGTYHYSCRIHPWMTGEIIVEESVMPAISNSTITSIQTHPQSSNNMNKTQSPNHTTQIPNWIRNNAKWWHDNVISDSDFEKGIQYLIQQGIIQVPPTQSSGQQSNSIPPWIKTNAGWWADGQISDDEFIKGLQYMINNGIIQIN
jgi:plastocyanin